MGRAQVVQAQAYRLDPDLRMNPVLLKPNSETGSQVIVLGKPVGNMDVNAYMRYKPQVFEKVKQAASLASEADAMVIEGEGSPAEVNVRHHDIVNMTMAALAGAPVLLVGAIDRGGLFDNDPFRRWFIDRLRTRRGLAAVGAMQVQYDLEAFLSVIERLSVADSLNPS